MFPDDEVATLVLQILETARVRPKPMVSAARRRGITVEQALAAAITEAVREKLSTFHYPLPSNAIGPDYFSYATFGDAATPTTARRKNNKRAAKR
jgi:hypothetical protein